MEITTLILGVFGGFLAGLFVATDKNRHALYQAKLDSHKKLSHAIAQASLYSLDSSGSEALKEARTTALFTLSQLLMSETMFMPKGMVEYLTEFISLPAKKHRDSDLAHKMLTLLRNDLGVKGLEFINQVSSLRPFLEHKTRETK